MIICNTNSCIFLKFKALPIVFSTFDLADILLCRHVSKTWRLIADTFLEKQLEEEPYDNDAFLKKLRRSPRDILPIPKFRSIQYEYIFKEEVVVQKFNELMAAQVGSGLSPFVGGATVTLQCFLSSSSTINPATKQFLEIFGPHIKRLNITQLGWDFNVQIPLFVEAVKTCLQNTPSLKYLTLSGKALGCREVNCKDNTDHNSNNNALIEREVYRNEVLRRSTYLLDLESLSLCLDDTRCNFRYLDELFGTIMIRSTYLGQLKQLALIWNKDCELPSQMRNLNELKLTVESRELEAHLPKIRMEGAPVDKLYLDLPVIFEPFSDMAVLSQILQSFSRLKYLKLREIPEVKLGKKFVLASNEIHTIELTHVTRLKGIKYGFLGAFKNLRCLLMHEDNVHSLWDQRVVDKHVRKMVPSTELILSKVVARKTFYDTCLWKISPNLNVVIYQYQHHKKPRRIMRCLDSSRIPCSCKRGSKDECEFMNITGTRVGYNKYRK